MSRTSIDRGAYREDWDGFTPIPEERWGKDHISTLLYAETRAVDHSGKIRHANMRTGYHNSHLLDLRMPAHEASDDYPTLLKVPEEAVEDALARQMAGEPAPVPTRAELWGHDDWDCLADAHHAGYVIVTMGENDQVSVEITEKGFEKVKELRRDRAVAQTNKKERTI